MVCPYCDGKSRVINSRSHNNGRGVWRRRHCAVCNAVWTTSENSELASTHRVSDGTSKAFSAFSRDVLFISIKDSLQHRKTAVYDAGELTDTIIGKVLSLKCPEIPARDLAGIVHSVLLRFDPTAAAVYHAKHTD